MTISNEVLDGLLSGCATADDLLGEEGLFKQLKKALLERMLGAEPSVHLGYEKGDSAGRGSGNSRNGYCGKTVLSDEGALDLSIPRDRNGTFEPQLAPKGRRASTGKPVLGPAKAGPVGRPDHQALWPRNDGAGGPGPPPLAQYSGHTQCGRSGDVGICRGEPFPFDGVVVADDAFLLDAQDLPRATGETSPSIEAVSIWLNSPRS